MIDRIYRTVRFICNTVLRGNVTPNEYELALYKSINEIYDNYFFELSKHLNRQNRGLHSNDFADVPQYLREKIRYYLEPATLPNAGQLTSPVTYFWVLPSDLRHLDGVYLNDNEVEPMENSRQFKLIQKITFSVMNEAENSVYLYANDRITVYPEPTVPATTLDIYYLRKPAYPKWTYNVVNGNEVFNPSASDFQDVDMHDNEENALVLKTLEHFGINLKEQDLAQYAVAMNNEEQQTETAT